MSVFTSVGWSRVTLACLFLLSLHVAEAQTGPNDPTVSVSGTSSVIAGHYATFDIDGQGGTPGDYPPHYTYLACAGCIPDPEVPGSPACAPGHFFPVFGEDPSLFRACGNPVGSHHVRARVVDSVGATSAIVEHPFEVLGPDNFKAKFKRVIVTAEPGVDILLFPATFEFDIRRGETNIGPCIQCCAQMKYWTPQAQPGDGWDPEDDEPPAYDAESCQCGQVPVGYCVTGSTFYFHSSCSVPVDKWPEYENQEVIFRGAVRIKILVPMCHGEELELEDEIVRVTCRKRDETSVIWSLN
jgi:hypothetical protein